MTREFEELISWGGSPQATCRCGRVHYTAEGKFMDPGELADLEINRKAHPDRYISTNDDAVSIGTIAGVTAVWGCPCGQFDSVEAFLWENRNLFLKYYRARIAREAKEAATTAGLLPETNSQ